MAARGIMTGVGGDKFGPEQQISRGEYVTMLMRMMDYSMSKYDTEAFSDIIWGTYWAESALKAAALGITTGRGDGTFGAGDIITRGEMFRMTYDALRKFYLIQPSGGGWDPLRSFTDADEIAPEDVEAARELVRNGIVRGSDGKLTANGSLSRAEAAQFMANVIRFIVPDFSGYIN
ncbi:MAG: S-layer homology domain-containing protein [Oscillospiraceae bacterium]|nr:S-layer homology domain-containing protein [Oscillospiraceae bacterium]